MKHRASGILKLIAALSSKAKSRSVAMKTKTNDIKARLIIFSLLMNKKYVMSTISDKFQSLLGHLHHPIPHLKEDCLLGDGSSSEQTMIINDNAHSHEVVTNPSEAELVMQDKDHHDGYDYESYYGEDVEGGDKKDSDLTYTTFETEDLEFGVSVIDLVQSSKEEAGQEFKMEDEIDHMADLFIKRFRRQILLQKQNSLKRFHDMVQN